MVSLSISVRAEVISPKRSASCSAIHVASTASLRSGFSRLSARSLRFCVSSFAQTPFLFRWSAMAVAMALAAVARRVPLSWPGGGGVCPADGEDEHLEELEVQVVDALGVDDEIVGKLVVVAQDLELAEEEQRLRRRPLLQRLVHGCRPLALGVVVFARGVVRVYVTHLHGER